MHVAIDLKLYATLAAHQPAAGRHHTITRGATVAQVIAGLGIAPGEIKLIFIDGRRASPDSVLQGGERLGLFPPVGGG